MLHLSETTGIGHLYYTLIRENDKPLDKIQHFLRLARKYSVERKKMF